MDQKKWPHPLAGTTLPRFGRLARASAPLLMRDHIYSSPANRSTLSTLIERGVLRPGDRVPSLRDTREQSGASLGTIMHAYARLEDFGLIEARSRSGYYVRAGLVLHCGSSVDVAYFRKFASCERSRPRGPVPSSTRRRTRFGSFRVNACAT